LYVLSGRSVKTVRDTFGEDNRRRKLRGKGGNLYNMVRFRKGSKVDSGKRKRDKKALLLGLGLDNDDGHARVTTGKNFHLVGGSEDTHEHMTEKAVKMNEELDRRKKRLEDVDKEEFLDIADRIKMFER